MRTAPQLRMLSSEMAPSLVSAKLSHHRGCGLGAKFGVLCDCDCQNSLSVTESARQCGRLSGRAMVGKHLFHGRKNEPLLRLLNISDLIPGHPLQLSHGHPDVPMFFAALVPAVAGGQVLIPTLSQIAHDSFYENARRPAGPCRDRPFLFSFSIPETFTMASRRYGPSMPRVPQWRPNRLQIQSSQQGHLHLPGAIRYCDQGIRTHAIPHQQTPMP